MCNWFIYAFYLEHFKLSKLCLIQNTIFTIYMYTNLLAKHKIWHINFVDKPYIIMWFTEPYHINIVTNPPGTPVDENNSTLEYLVGSDLNLTCLVTPAPPADSVLRWSCSTGCFTDMRMERTINVSDLNTTDNGSITCIFTINGLEYRSEPFNLLVSG